MEKLYVLLEFLLITISLLANVGSYYYLYHTNHWYKKQILTYLHLNNKLKEINITNTLKKKKMKKFKLKQIDLENHPCYYFDDIINIIDLNLYNILIDTKSFRWKYFKLWCCTQTAYGGKSLQINFCKLDKYIKKDGGSKYTNEKYERNFERIRYLISLKSNIWDSYFHKYRKITINSDDDLPLEKTTTMHNVVIPIISV